MADPAGRLTGRLILVTGAGRGIGAAIAARIRREGGEVIATDRAAGNGVVELDVAREGDWLRVVGGIDRPLDGLVHAAGICPVASLEDTTPELWRRTMAVNAEGAFLGCRAVWPRLKESSGASIVIIASMAARVTSPLFPAYSASKAAVVALAQAVALDGARCTPPIRCNTVSPGFVKTDMLAGIGEDLGNAAKHAERSAKMAPLRRLADPDEIANPVAHLLSPESSYITATDLLIDGGVSSQ